MSIYYAKRNGLITQTLSLSLEELLNSFIQVYHYFNRKGSFELAFKGANDENRWTHEIISILPPTMAPSPDVFFMTHLQDKQIWPITEYYESYTEEILFSVIEMLYAHIGVYNYSTGEIDVKDEKALFSEQVNNLLRAYKDGYYLDLSNGFIMEMPNKALQEQLSYDGAELPEDVLEQLKSASRMYYRFDTDMEAKKKAINILADILEKVRDDLKETLNQEYDVSKNEHDRLIFGVVNGYNIRHNKADQKTDYSREIWYDWMMQYYTSTIITYYKLKKVHSNP